VEKLLDSIIIGGGQSGLVTGYYFQQHQLDFVILDANADIGGSWQHYWDSLRLFSPTKYSSLDGLPYPAEVGYYPSRQDMIAYLQAYQTHFDLPVINNAYVTKIHKNKYFEVMTNTGDCYHAKTIICATGSFTKPYIPKIKGQPDFVGEQIHSYLYRSPQKYTGQRIIVVGSNNSAIQIAYELEQVADVTLAISKKIKFAPMERWGKNVFFYLHDTGFDMLPIGCMFNLCVSDTVYDDGRFEQAIRNGNPDTRPMFTELTRNGVVWAEGTVETIDIILYATGFSANNKPYLAALPALDADGLPEHRQGTSIQVTGLFYVGLEGQISPASATIRGVSRDAKVIAAKVAQLL